ncbi:hypothetical protein [Nitrospira sp. BLG_2]|uniref:hypothetical protein n=1 Tax=Nitrospira sp. BLG_2 TaxID=3397507 RepID=UPI003B992D0D
MMRWRQEAVPGRPVGHRDCEATPERQAVAVAPGSTCIRPVPAMTRTLCVRPSSRGWHDGTSSDGPHNFRKSPWAALQALGWLQGRHGGDAAFAEEAGPHRGFVEQESRK